MTISRCAVAVMLVWLGACGGKGPATPTAAGHPTDTITSHKPRSLDGCLRQSPRVQFVHIGLGGVTLQGAVLGTGRLGVVLSNQSGVDLCDWVPFARKIAAHHHRALVCDGQGVAEQVEAAASKLRSLGVRRTVAMGASVGAVASIRAVAGSRTGFDGLVSVSGERVIGGDVKPDAKHIRVPAMFISARGDASAAAATKLFYRVAPSKDKHLLMLPGSLHGEALFSGPQRKRVEKTVLRFIDHLGS